jgi:hypothetical protein
MTKTQSMNFKALNIIAQKHENNYIEWIHAKYIFRLWWIKNYLAKGVMENHYNCNRLKNVMWYLIFIYLFWYTQKNKGWKY